MTKFLKQLTFFIILLSALFAAPAATMIIDMSLADPLAPPIDIDLGALSPDEGSYAQSFEIIFDKIPSGNSVAVYAELSEEDYYKCINGCKIEPTPKL